MDWARALDPERAVKNLRTEFSGDWHRDPWCWPEYDFLLRAGVGQLYRRCNDTGSYEVAKIDVPKDNFGVRPAVVLDPVDRLVYQMLVDKLSPRLIGDMKPDVYGWRLPPGELAPGQYARNDHQWENYRGHLGHLADFFPAALKTDLVSFFASINLKNIEDELSARAPANKITERVLSLLSGWNGVEGRSGLPQRSSASAVLANMLLQQLDDVLVHAAKRLPRSGSAKVDHFSYARWMDDVWLFNDDPGRLRQAQLEIQNTVESLGLHVNSGKTELLEGDEVAERAKEIEHSAVDSALVPPFFPLGGASSSFKVNTRPLEEMIDEIIERKGNVPRTTIVFVAKRMRDHDLAYRLDDLLEIAPRMPHAADRLALLFRDMLRTGEIQEWFLHYVRGPWAKLLEWPIAQFGTAIPSSRPPRKRVREFFAEALVRGNTSLPLTAVAARKLALWSRSDAKVVLREAVRHADNSHHRRVLALAGLEAGETRGVVRRWLSQMPENEVTLTMLEADHFRPRKMAEE